MADPAVHLNSRFQVEIEGIAATGFAEVILPEAQADIIEYRGGAEPRTRKLPGLVKFGNLILRRGVTQSDDLYLWWKSVADGATERRTVAVILLDEQRQPVKRWVAARAWPARYTVAPLIANDCDVALIETVECAVEDFVLDR